MKKWYIFILIFLFTISFAPRAWATSTEQITNFHVEAVLNQKRLLKITETIRYDFGRLTRHGIYRVIPERYDRNGAKYRYRYHFGEATIDGRRVQSKITHEGDAMRIRLGDPEKTVTGEHIYTITYTTDRVINDFPDEGVRELYWNVTGNDWNIPVQKASFTLKGPGEASNIICFTGVYGSTEKNCDIQKDGASITINTRAKEGMSTAHLPALEGMTVAIRYPEALIASVSVQTKIIWFLSDNWWVFIPLLVFTLMYGLWYVKGRDPKGRGTVVAQFEEPRGLTPIEMAGLLHQHIPNKAVAATILDFGRRGYLKIHFDGDPTKKSLFGKKVKFSLKKIRDADKNMSSFEATFFKKLFSFGKESLDVSKVDVEIANAVMHLKKKVFKALKKKKLFGKDPATVRTIWIGTGVFLLFAGIYLIAFFGPLSVVALLLSSIIVIAFGWFMPRATHKGAVVREEVEGFKLFLSVTEKDRIKFHNAPETRPEHFERFLPTAVAFGVEKEWAGHFENLMIKPPSYFSGNTVGWNAMNMAGVASAFNAQTSSSAFRVPSSSGSGGSGFSGGGSGGGGGGGGGGSW